MKMLQDLPSSLASWMVPFLKFFFMSLRVALIIFFLLSLQSSICSAKQAEQYRSVVVLHSYHKGQKWTDDLSSGIESVLKLDDIELNFEYMDTIRFPDEDHLEEFFVLLNKKYKRHNKKVDVVIATDEEALAFILLNRREIFPGSSVVYCGIDFYTDRFWEPRLTGIIESVDLASNVLLAKKLNPGLTELFVVMDNTPTSISLINNFIPVIREFAPEITIRFSDFLTFNDLLSQIRQLSEESAVFLINYTNAKNGRVLSMTESARRIAETCPVPVYSVWDCYMGQGILGGKMISGWGHGRQAAELALRIVNGEKAENIPVQTRSHNQYVFDYNILQKFNIDAALLPEDRLTLNTPDTLYHRFKRLFVTLFIGTLFLILIILILSLNIAHRRRVERSLKRYSDRLDFLHRLDQSILDGFSLESIGAQVFKPTIQRVKCDLVGIYLFEREMMPALGLALKKEALDKPIENIAIDVQQLPAELIEKRRAVTFGAEDVSERKRLFTGAEFGSLEKSLLLPLLYKKELLGIFFLGYEGGRSLGQHQIVIGQQIAHSLALAIQNHYLFLEISKHESALRHMSLSIIGAQELERKRLSAELHDEFGQSLTAIGINFSVIRRKIDSVLDNKMRNRMGEIEQTIEHLSEQVHDLSLDLRPPMLDDLGLIPTFRWFVAQYQDRSGLKIDFTVSITEESNLRSQVAVTMYRVLQEALNNVSKHACATKAEVQLSMCCDRVCLVVKDDGKGFDTNRYRHTEPGQGGIGLIGMHERLDLLNGTLEIYSILNAGTTIKAIIPITEEMV